MFEGKGVPKRLKNVTRHPIDVYLPDSTLKPKELLGYLENRGYEVQILEDPREVSNGLPPELPRRDYTIAEINVYLTQAKDLSPLATLARNNNCYAVHRLTNKILKGRER